ncbi:serine hydrolase domain-containing protein [Agromyces allii]|uniref:Beta-lactamase-related domain-containing protein n=1 Tax=Agromyces allii TaxID=393607 RepID=A0ABN2QPW0_9MICO|nr:serine hydrolase [Agromyces allii]
MPPRQVSSRGARKAIAALLAGLIAVSFSACVAEDAPTPVDATPNATETALERDVRNAFYNDYERAAVAVIEDGEVTTVYQRADEHTVYEIGSITKVLTGELLAIAIERGEVGLDDPLGAYLPLGDAPAASVTLRSLATHRSGLPFEPTGPAFAAEYEAGGNPYDATLDELLAFARAEPVAPSPDFEYSNLGAALLGHALAAAAGTDYATLLEGRVLEPLGMVGTVVVETPEQVPAGHAGGYDVPGDPVDPWWGEGFAPAGMAQATLPDLIALAEAVLDGPLSDSAALVPIAPGTNRFEQLGYFWWILEKRPRTLTEHAGTTEGFRSDLLIDRDAGIASIVLVNSRRDVSPLALRYLVEADNHGD